jgi:hypothetical protein
LSCKIIIKEALLENRRKREEKESEWLAHTGRSHDRHTHAHGLIHTHTHTHTHTRARALVSANLQPQYQYLLPYLVAPRLFFYLPAETLLSHGFSKESVNRSVLP